MTSPDWPTIGVSVAAALTTIAGKMGFDKVRGGNGSDLKEKVEAHIKDDEDKFASMTKALEKVVSTSEKISEKLDRVAEDSAYIRGQLSKD